MDLFHDDPVATAPPILEQAEQWEADGEDAGEPECVADVLPASNRQRTITPRDYQEATIQSIFNKFFVEGWKSTLAVLFTSAGKTIIFSEVIRRWTRGRVLVLAHRQELIHQAASKIEWVSGTRPDIDMADQQAIHGEFSDKGPVVGSVQTVSRLKRLKNYDWSEFGLIIVDECFPAGTMVDGKPIEEYKIGDYVTCYNHDANRIAFRRVSHVFKSVANAPLLKIKTTGGRTIISTANHPYWSETEQTYKSASLLRPGEKLLVTENHNGPASCETEGLRIVRGHIPSTSKGQKVLFEGVPVEGCKHSIVQADSGHAMHKLRNHGNSDQVANAERKGLLRPDLQACLYFENIVANDGQNQSEICFSKDEEKQPDASARIKTENGSVPAFNELEASSAWREWKWPNSLGENAGRRIELANECCGSNQDAARHRISNLLQTGLGKSGTEDWRGSRWDESRNEGTTGSGSEEGKVLGYDWVDSVEIYQSASGIGTESLCGSDIVYNLEVEEFHNYFADGVLVHNCHHAIAGNGQYFNIIHAARQANPEIRLLGVTATPKRADEVSLANVFESVAARYDVAYGLDNSYIVPLRQQMIQVEGLDFSRVRLSKGELKESDLLAAFDNVPEQVVKAIAAAIEIIGDRKAIWFTVSVAQAEQVANEINKIAGHNAAFVSGKTDKEVRRKIISDFESGHYNHLANCAVFSEGTDIPSIQAIVMMRPYKSLTMHTQVIGRGFRVLPGVIDGINDPEARRAAIAASRKPDCLVIDFVGNTGNHKLSTVADVLGLEDSEAIERAMAQADRYLAGQDVRAAVKQARADIDREKKEEEERKEEMKRQREEERRKKEEARRKVYETYAKARYTAEHVDPLHGDSTPTYHVPRKDPLTPRQRQVLEEAGFDPDAMNAWQAKKKIEEICSKPTPKQLETLKRFGEHGVTSKPRAEVLFAVITSGQSWKARTFPLNERTVQVDAGGGKITVQVVTPEGKRITVCRNRKDADGKWSSVPVTFASVQSAADYAKQAMDPVKGGAN